MIFSSSHDHGPALSFFHTATITGQFYHFLKQPRSRTCVIIFFIFLYCHDLGPVLSFSQAATITGLRYHFFFIYTATIMGQFYHLPKQPRTRACVIILYCHDHGPVLSFPQAATITGLRYHFFKFFLFIFIFFLFYFFYTASITGQISHFLMLPRSRASVSFSSSHDHGPAL